MEVMGSDAFSDEFDGEWWGVRSHNLVGNWVGLGGIISSCTLEYVYVNNLFVCMFCYIFRTLVFFMLWTDLTWRVNASARVKRFSQSLHLYKFLCILLTFLLFSSISVIFLFNGSLIAIVLNRDSSLSRAGSFKFLECVGCSFVKERLSRINSVRDDNKCLFSKASNTKSTSFTPLNGLSWKITSP
jgi:hypothetical protein